MSKVILFSRTFPAYHPKAGQKTRFVEKLYASIYPNGLEKHFNFYLEKLNPDISSFVMEDFFNRLDIEKTTPKHHTIRAGHHFKVGDKFSPRVWSGKPYRSKQIIIAPDIEVKKVWDFRIYDWGDRFPYIELAQSLTTAFTTLSNSFVDEIARNDGFNDRQELLEWLQYPKPFDGQIICWNEKINY